MNRLHSLMLYSLCCLMPGAFIVLIATRQAELPLCILALYCVLLIASIVESHPPPGNRTTAAPVEEQQASAPSAYPAIIAIGLIALAFVLVPNFLRARSSPHCCSNCKSNLKNIGTAMEMYSSDFQGRYPPSLAHITPNYLKTLPTCSSAGTMTYTYVSRVMPDMYTTWCSGSYHTPMTHPDYPKYDAIQGLYEK